MFTGLILFLKQQDYKKNMTKLNRTQLKRILIEELMPSDQASEMEEFSRSKSGKRVMKTGESIKKCGMTMREVALDQTGLMRKSLGTMSEFMYKIGNALSGMNELKENESMSSKLPTLQEYKALLKELQKLEKM